MELKIASFNIRNNDKENKEEKANVLADIITKENIDIIGIQEMTKSYESVLKKLLPSYRLYGKYRLGSTLFSKIKYNENNAIITNKKVIFSKTIWLPFLADNMKDLKTSIIKKSLTPRIATMLIINDKDLGKIRVINTHLDYKIDNIKAKQLEKLKKIILKYEKKYPVILMGDFNMEQSDKEFKKFIDDLEKNRIKKVKIKENTYGALSGKGNQIDHIFIPADWKVLDCGVLDNRNISDHRPIFVKVEYEKRNIKNYYAEKIRKVFNIKN